MNILTTFAQTLYTYPDNYTSNGTGDDAAVTALILGMLVFSFVLTIVAYVVISFCLMSIFKKAGIKPWIAWVPVYNYWKMLEIGGQQGFWAALAIIPVVNYVSAVFIYIAMYHIGKKLGKGDAFVVLGILLPLVWFIWLAVDSSRWNDKASSAPSLA